MKPQYDVFSGSPASPLWFGSADELNRAISQMEERARAIPGDYFVFDSSRQTVVAWMHTNANKDPDSDGEFLAGR